VTTLGTRSLYAAPPDEVAALGEDVQRYFAHLHETVFGVGVGALGNLNANHFAIEGRETLTATGRNPLLTADAESGVLSAREGVALGEVETDSDGLLVGADGAVAVASTALASGYVTHSLTAGYEALEHVPLDDTATDADHVWSAAQITAAIGAASTGGTVTSVDVDGASTGLTFTGGPITVSGTITLGGTLAQANGGTGATSAAAAVTALGGAAATGTAGTGLVYATAPTLSAPVLGNATATSLKVVKGGSAPAMASSTVAQFVYNAGGSDSAFLQVDSGGGVGGLSGLIFSTAGTQHGLLTVSPNLQAAGFFYGAGAPTLGITLLGGTDEIILKDTAGDALLTLSGGTNSAVFVGAVSGSNLSGTNTGDQDLSSYLTTAAAALAYQPLAADLTSWAGVTRAAGFDTFAATPTSANLAALVTEGRTGTGALVCATSPTLVTPNIGAATGTSLSLGTGTSGAPLEVTGATAAAVTDILGVSRTLFSRVTWNLTGTPAAQNVSFLAELEADSTGATSGVFNTLVVLASIKTGNAQNYTGTLRGINLAARHNGTGTLTTGMGAIFPVQLGSTGTVTSAVGAQATLSNVSGGTITTAKGFEVARPTGGSGAAGTWGSTFGLYVNDQNPTGSTNVLTNPPVGLYLASQTASNAYAIQSAGGQSYHVGNLRLGSTTAPTVALDVTGAALISTTLGVTGTTTLAGCDATSIGATTPGTLVATSSKANSTSMPVAGLSLSNGANSNVALPATGHIYITGPTAAFNITGIVAPAAGIADGYMLYVYNSTAYNLTWTHNATSTAANQIFSTTGADVAGTGASATILVYSATLSRWIIFSHIG